MSSADVAITDVTARAVREPAGGRTYAVVTVSTSEGVGEMAAEPGVTAFKSGIPGYYEWIDTTRSIKLAVGQIERLRRGLVSSRLA